jgi:5-methylcytosine-specific restriction protein A
VTWHTSSRHERGYGSQWDKVRLEILARDHGLCQCAQCQDGVKLPRPATEVHHIVSKARAKQMRWTQQQVDDPSNLQAINSECHKRITLAEQGKSFTPKTTTGADGWPVASRV